MTDQDFKRNRIEFLRGVIEGIRLYAIWKDGQQVVGCLQRPLKEVLEPYNNEITRILTQLQPE
jgi:hypothetical protein